MNSVASSAEALVDVALAVGSLLVAEFLASCAAYACAMYSYGDLVEEGEALVAPNRLSNQPANDRVNGARGNLRLIVRRLSPSVEEVESHRPLPLRDALPFTYDVPLVSRFVRPSPAWYESIGTAVLALGRSIGQRWAVRRAAAELRQLDDRLLRDMGICRLDIESAARGKIDLG